MTIIELIEEYAESTGDKETSKEFIDFITNTQNPFSRNNGDNHITGSAWIVSNNMQFTLLTLHKKLNIWIQTGGHSEGESDPLKIAVREAEEETGLKLRMIERQIFSLDIHHIPAYEGTSSHKHYDITYIFTPLSDHNCKISNESLDLKWIDINELNRYTKEKNILKMGLKTQNLIKNNYISILNN